MNHQVNTLISQRLAISGVFIIMAVLLFGIDFYFYEGYEEIRMACSSLAILSLTPSLMAKSFWKCIGLSAIFMSLYTFLVFLSVEMQMAERFLALFIV